MVPILPMLATAVSAATPSVPGSAWLHVSQADDQGVVSAYVDLADLDLAQDPGQDEARQRLRIAARTVCERSRPSETLYSTGPSPARTCWRDTLMDARPRLEAALVNARNGQRLASIGMALASAR